MFTPTEPALQPHNRSPAGCLGLIFVFQMGVISLVLLNSHATYVILGLNRKSTPQYLSEKIVYQQIQFGLFSVLSIN